MSFRLVISKLAGDDVDVICSYLSMHSPTGAMRWLEAFQTASIRLLHDPEGREIISGMQFMEIPVRRYYFKTQHGRTYYGLFIVQGNEIRILRVRAPGQTQLHTADLE